MGEYKGDRRLSHGGGADRTVASSSTSPHRQRLIFAVLIFDSHSAFQTSLLLSNAIIINHPIHVQPFRNVLPIQMQKQLPKVDYSQGVPADRSASSVVQSLVSSGYLKSERFLEGMRERARNLDDRVLRIGETWHSVRQKFSAGTEGLAIGGTVNKIGERSVESLRNTKSYIDNTWKSVDDKLRLTDKADTAKAGIFVAGVQAKEQFNRANTKMIDKIQGLQVDKKLKDTSSSIRNRVSDLKVDERLRNVNESMQSGFMSGWSYFKGALNNVVDQFKGDEEEAQQQHSRRGHASQRTSSRSSQMRQHPSSMQEELPDALADSDDDEPHNTSGPIDYDDIPEMRLSDSDQDDDDDELSEDDLFSRPSMGTIGAPPVSSLPAVDTTRVQQSLLDLGADDSDGTPVSAIPLIPTRPVDDTSATSVEGQGQDLLSFDDMNNGAQPEEPQQKDEQLLEFD